MLFADGEVENPHDRVGRQDRQTTNCRRLERKSCESVLLTVLLHSGIPLDKSVSVPSHPRITEVLTVSALSTMLPTWTRSTTSSNGYKRSTDTQQRASTSCSLATRVICQTRRLSTTPSQRYISSHGLNHLKFSIRLLLEFLKNWTNMHRFRNLLTVSASHSSRLPPRMPAMSSKLS